MTSSAYAIQLNKMCSDICLEAIVKNRWKAIHFFLSFDVYSTVKKLTSFENDRGELDVCLALVDFYTNGRSIYLGKWSGVKCYLIQGSDRMALVSVN